MEINRLKLFDINAIEGIHEGSIKIMTKTGMEIHKDVYKRQLVMERYCDAVLPRF